MKYRAYIDIETTGLSRRHCELTVVGIALEKNGLCRIVQLLEAGLSDQKLLAALRGVDEIYSYNGSRFDLPFIKARLGVDLKACFKHTDLMYDCWRNKLKGGLKAVERQLGIERRLKGVDGYMAVKLWYDYVNKRDRQALATLLEYNREDIVNLPVLRRKLNVE
ncbi:MAG: ribonuclease H-like domain-containing protein [Phycisphaerales bacterium]|nr:MAG: ribonuclease H-like domain-containing protein [Phycisphaerales bacterium]